MTTKQEILQKVGEVIANQLNIERCQIMPESSFIGDFQTDSLEIVELVLALEDNFDIEISDEDADYIKTVNDAVEYIENVVNDAEKFNLAFEILSEADCDWAYKDRKNLMLLGRDILQSICDKLGSNKGLIL